MRQEPLNLKLITYLPVIKATWETLDMGRLASRSQSPWPLSHEYSSEPESQKLNS